MSKILSKANPPHNREIPLVSRPEFLEHREGFLPATSGKELRNYKQA